jgi:predicted DNA binding CopG/RHH family protein
MKKKIPTFKSDREAEEFVASTDLAKYDLSGAEIVRFELKPKDKSINLRLSAPLLDAVRRKARSSGVPYQRFIRLTLERAVRAKS